MTTLTKYQDFLLLGLILLLIGVVAIPILTYPLGTDQGEFATIGRGFLDGKAPYKDLWNPKPPAVFYVYALAMTLLGSSVTALHAINFFTVPLIGLGLYWLGRRLGNRRIGLWAFLIFAALYLREPFWGMTQNDGIAILPMVGAAMATLKAGDATPGSRSALGYAFLAGFLCVVVLWFKYPFGLFLFAMVIAHLLRRRKENWQNIMKEAGAFCLGGLLVGLGGIVHLATMGAADDWIESIGVTSGYTSISYDPTQFMRVMVEPAVSLLMPYNWGWAVPLVILWPFLRHKETRRVTGWSMVFLWAIAATLGMLVQAKGYSYHWQPIMAPIALLAAYSLDRLLTWFSAKISAERTQLTYTSFAALGGVSLLMLIALRTWETGWPYIFGGESKVEYYDGFVIGNFVASDSLQVSNYLEERISDNEELFIWGFRPDVYYTSGLDPATRIFMNFPLMWDWSPQEWRDETIEQLKADPPPYVLVLFDDPMDLITGRGDDDSLDMLEDFTALNEWLNANYTEEKTIGNFIIWRNNDLAGKTPAQIQDSGEASSFPLGR